MALSANRMAMEMDPPKGFVQRWTVEDAKILYSGALVARLYTDEITPAADTEGLQVIGVRKGGGKIDNSDDGESGGVATGVYLLENSSSYAVPRSAIGQPCFVEDDETVAGYSTNYVAAGLVRDVVDAGVLVDVRPHALAQARAMTPPKREVKADDWTITAAEAFSRRVYYVAADGDGDSLITGTLPDAVAGMRIGVQRSSATAADDVSVQAASGDKVQGSDAMSAAAKKIDNKVDAVSDVLWLECFDDTHWVLSPPAPSDFGSWVKNDA